MAHLQSPQESTRAIRRRLQTLLAKAFVTVFTLTLLLMLAAVFVVISSSSHWNPFLPSPVALTLEEYYRVHGGWADIETLQTPSFDTSFNFWDNALLLDKTGKIVLDHGLSDTLRVGTTYIRQPGEFQMPLMVREQPVGALVLELSSLTHPWRLYLRMLTPLGMVAVLLGILTLLIGLLLMRRMVNPLAEVIATAQSVAAGDLSARVPVQSSHDDLRTLSDHFNHMAAELERSDRERRNLLADITHELRTPLTVLRGRLEGILDGIYPADQEHIAPALEEAYLLERLVDDLRLLTLAETRQLHYDLRSLDLGELAEKVVGLFEAQASEKSICLNVKIQPGLPPVYADPQRVEQVIGNLLGNALRYSPSESMVEMSVRQVAEGVELTVSDNGPGVLESDLPYIFDRFWRSEKSRSRATGGAGLGLAIARQLIDAQGGAITARNLAPNGLKISFVLPAQPSATSNAGKTDLY
jgi:signal transduction histidine kinase